MSKLATKGWRYARCGPIGETLKLESYEIKPTAQQAVVKISSAPLHRVDSAIVNGSATGRNKTVLPAFPRVGGAEAVGVVVRTGGSQHIKEGDTVWVAPVAGTWAEQIAVDPALVHRIDAKHAKLAVCASNLIAAQHLVKGVAPLKKGSAIVQNGGSSLTSLAVSALAKNAGVPVFTAASKGDRFADAKARHAKYGSQVFEYNGAGARAMKSALGNANVSLYLNGVGGREFDTFLKLAGHGAHVVSYGAQNSFGLMFSGSSIIYNELTMQGFYLPAYVRQTPYSEVQTKLDFVLNELSAAGFSYPTVSAASLSDLPKVWDAAFVHGGRKGIVEVSK